MKIKKTKSKNACVCNSTRDSKRGTILFRIQTPKNSAIGRMVAKYGAKKAGEIINKSLKLQERKEYTKEELEEIERQIK